MALPLQHNQALWVREHRFLTATENISYDWYPTDVWYETGQDSDDREMHYPMGRFGDVFSAHEGPGLLLVHAPGNTFIRDLQPRQSLLTQPSSLLYRDVSVRVALHLEYPGTWASRSGAAGGATAASGSGCSARAGWRCSRCTPPPEDTEVIRRHSYGTTHHW